MDRSTTSGRRKAPRKPPSLTLIAIVVVTLAIVLVVVFRPKRHEEPASAAARSPTATVPTPPSRPPETSSPAFVFNDDEDLEDEEESEAAEPPPTPGASACVRYSWRAGLRALVEEPVPIEITITNGCAFEVDCSSLVFKAQGLRGDESLESGTGAYQGVLKPGESTLFTLTLPEIGGGYDRVAVTMAS